jgi:hypothetical protein
VSGKLAQAPSPITAQACFCADDGAVFSNACRHSSSEYTAMLHVVAFCTAKTNQVQCATLFWLSQLERLRTRPGKGLEPLSQCFARIAFFIFQRKTPHFPTPSQKPHPVSWRFRNSKFLISCENKAGAPHSAAAGKDLPVPYTLPACAPKLFGPGPAQYAGVRKNQRTCGVATCSSTLVDSTWQLLVSAGCWSITRTRRRCAL